MNRRNFLATFIAGGTAVLAGKFFSITKYLTPEKYKDVPVTRIVDLKIIEKGISEIGLFNTQGKLISRQTFDPIYLNKGDTVEFKYILTVDTKRYWQ